MGKIILLNGPPSSGKDTAALHIFAHYTVNDEGKYRPQIDRMSFPIKRAFAGFMQAAIDNMGNVHPYEKTKEQIIPELGVSYRKWQIDFSEKLIKPQYGERTFGELLAARTKRRFDKNICQMVIVPDCGFQIEIDVLYSKFDPKDILLIRCHRGGFTFVNDSRSFVRAPSGCFVADACNSTTMEHYQTNVEYIVNSWLKEPEIFRVEE